MVIILELSHPIVWLVRHVCSDKAEFSEVLCLSFISSLIMQKVSNLDGGMLHFSIISIQIDSIKHVM